MKGKQSYYKETKVITYIFLLITIVILLRGVFPYNTVNSFFYNILRYFCVIYSVTILFAYTTNYLDALRLHKEVGKLREKFQYDELINLLLEKDLYYQPYLYKGFYNRKKIQLKLMIITTLLQKREFEKAEEIHSDLVQNPNRSVMNIQDEIVLRFLFIAIQCDKQNVKSVEEEISVVKERITHLKRNKIILLYSIRLHYYEILLAYLKEDFDGLDQELIQIINQETSEAVVVMERYVLGKIYVKQKNDKKAIEEFSFVLKQNKNFTRYQEAEEYYQQLTA